MSRRLPVELIDRTVALLSNNVPSLAYGVPFEVLYALLNLSVCSRALYGLALPHLYSSLTITSHKQLKLLCRTLDTTRSNRFGSTFNDKKPLANHIRSLFLAPEDSSLENAELRNDIIYLFTIINDASPCFCRLAFKLDLRTITAFEIEDDDDASSIGSWQIWVEKNGAAKNEVRRLYVPERGADYTSLLVRHRHDICRLIGNLDNIEEIVSIQDEVYLSDNVSKWSYNDGWSCHTSLKRLAVYNPILDEEFIVAISRTPHLIDIVAVRPDMDPYFIWNFCQAFGHKRSPSHHDKYFNTSCVCKDENSMHTNIPRKLRLLIFIPKDRIYSILLPDFPPHFISSNIEILIIQSEDVDILHESCNDGCDNNNISFAQRWMNQQLLKGSLWKPEGALPFLEVYERLRLPIVNQQDSMDNAYVV